MGGHKTIDGINLADIVRAVKDVEGVRIRHGAKHTYVLNYAGMKPCPLSTNINVRKCIVPWLYEITGLERYSIYESLRNGRSLQN